MSQFYIPPDQIPGGGPQSEPTEIAALRMQNERMREILKRLEWCDGSRPAFCSECNRHKTLGHRDDCDLGILLNKETT